MSSNLIFSSDGYSGGKFILNSVQTIHKRKSDKIFETCSNILLMLPKGEVDPNDDLTDLFDIKTYQT